MSQFYQLKDFAHFLMLAGVSLVGLGVGYYLGGVLFSLLS